MLSQADTIKMLAERLSAYEVDLARGTKAEFLRAALGNLGELYAAMLTRGQIANANNQPGYDIISEGGERISVKTTSQNPARISFRETTFENVDRVMVLRLNNSEDSGLNFEILLDISGTDTMRDVLGSNLVYYEGTKREAINVDAMGRIACATYGNYRIDQLENTTILVFDLEGSPVTPAKPVLRTIAAELGIDTLSPSGLEKNTRQMGDHIIKALSKLEGQVK